MKKRILLFALTVSLFACFLAVGAMAADNVPTFDDVKVTVIPTINAPKNITDTDAKIMLKNSDGTYVVYPSHYLLNDSKNAQFNATRNGIKDTNGKDYTRSSIIRLQIPQDCTHTGNQGFNNSVNMIELDFGANSQVIRMYDSSFAKNTSLLSVTLPKTLEKMDSSVFNSCSALHTVNIDPDCALTSMGNSNFAGTAITYFCYPKNIVKITNGSTFYGCPNLKKVEFAKGSQLTEFTGGETFKGCSQLEEVIFPNTLEKLGSSMFHNCTKLKTINFGASIKTIGTKQTAGSGITTVYISDTLFKDTAASDIGGLWGWGNDYPPKFLYYTGDADEAEAFMKKIVDSGNNAKFTEATVIEYSEFEKLAESERTAKCYFIYGYSSCEAFYNGNHTEPDNLKCVAPCTTCGQLLTAENPVHTLVNNCQYTNGYLYQGTYTVSCGVEKCTYFEDKGALDAIITFIGYSVPEKNANRITASYAIDLKAKSIYEALTEGTLEFGVVASFADVSESIEPVVIENGAVKSGYNKTVCFLFDSGYSGFDFILSGFTSGEADYSETPFVMCAFVSDGTKVDYIGYDSAYNEVQTEYATTITVKTFA